MKTERTVMINKQDPQAKNILGTNLKPCCMKPSTGFFRDGFCNTNHMDHGTHVICSVMTSDFLEFTKSQGNDLSTPRPEYEFKGLKPGDVWCLCALRWKQAYDQGLAPPIKPESTHAKSLEFINMDQLKEYAKDS
jgi:uncharacterized protein (DUF2237 family)